MSLSNGMSLIVVLAIVPLLLFGSLVVPMNSWTLLCLVSVLIIAYSVRTMLGSGSTV